MGNTIASCYECLNAETGKFDLLKYSVYCHMQQKKCDQEQDQLNKLIATHRHEEEEKRRGISTCGNKSVKKKKRRSCKSILS
eukprot:5451399-Ditylum_brightwellii.AAC.1